MTQKWLILRLTGTVLETYNTYAEYGEFVTEERAKRAVEMLRIANRNHTYIVVKVLA